jgi:hypothetical protein
LAGVRISQPRTRSAASKNAGLAVDCTGVPPRGHAYFAFVDPTGGGGDYYTCCIGHRQDDRFICDVIMGETRVKPEDVTARFAEVLRTYRIKEVTGDAYARQWASGRMSAHRIKLLPLPERHGRTPMVFNGTPIGTSTAAIYAGARWLLDNGLAASDDTVESWRGGTLCMSGKADILAKWSVTGSDRQPHLRASPL